MLTAKENSILILPPELLEAIGDYLPRKRNSHADALFNLAFSCKLLFDLLSPKMHFTFENMDSEPIDLQNYLSTGTKYSFPETAIPPLRQRIAKYTQRYIVTFDVTKYDLELYFPRFYDLKLLDLYLESFEFDEEADDMGRYSTTICYPTIFRHIGCTYANLKTLAIQRYVWCAETCTVMSNLLQSLSCLHVLELDLVQEDSNDPFEEVSKLDQPTDEELNKFATSLSKLKYLEKFYFTCRPSFVGLLIEKVLRELVATPISMLTLRYWDELSEDAQVTLEQLIIERNLSDCRFEELHLNHECILVVQSFTIPSDSLVTVNKYIPVDFSCLEARPFADTEDSTTRTTVDLTDFRNLEAFYFGGENIEQSGDEVDMERVGPLVLTMLIIRESKKLRLLELINLQESQLEEAIEILEHVSSLDHLSLSIAEVEDDEIDVQKLRAFASAVTTCTMRRTLKSLTLKSSDFLRNAFLNRILHAKVRINEIIIDVSDVTVSPAAGYSPLIERCFGVMGGKEKKRICFPQSSVYEDLVFDANEHVLRLAETFTERNVIIFSTILEHVHRVILDNVRDKIVDRVMGIYSSKFKKMGVQLGIVGVEYCLYRNWKCGL